MLFEVESVVCVLLDNFEDLDRLSDNLNMLVSSCAEKVSRLLLPRGRHRHLDAISTLLVQFARTWLTSKNNNIVSSHDESSMYEFR